LIEVKLWCYFTSGLGFAVCAQEAVFDQDSFENTSNQTEIRLDTVIELLEQSRQ
jgi:hypothetical protein